MPTQRLGQMLKQLREKQGLTQADLARKAKVGQSYIAMLERGDRTNPSLEKIQRLAKALGVKVGALLGRKGKGTMEADTDTVYVEFSLPESAYLAVERDAKRAGRTVEEQINYVIAVQCGLRPPEPGDPRSVEFSKLRTRSAKGKILRG